MREGGKGAESKEIIRGELIDIAAPPGIITEHRVSIAYRRYSERNVAIVWFRITDGKEGKKEERSILPRQGQIFTLGQNEAPEEGKDSSTGRMDLY